MTNRSALLLLVLAAGCSGGGSSMSTSPPATPTVAGSWTGDASVVAASPSDYNCAFVAHSNPLGEANGVRAVVAQDGRNVDLRFEQHMLLAGLRFTGQLTGDELHATAELSGWPPEPGCSPNNSYYFARVVSGTLDGRAGETGQSGTATVVYQTIDYGSGTPIGEPFTLRLSFTLQRAAG